MEYNPVGWFEVPVTDLDRAEKFYNAVLGYEFNQRHEMQGGGTMSWFPMQEKIMGAPGTLVLHEAYKPSMDGVLIYFSRPNLDEACELVKENGGEVLVPKMQIGEYGFMAVIKDTEGNKVALHAQEG